MSETWESLMAKVGEKGEAALEPQTPLCPVTGQQPANGHQAIPPESPIEQLLPETFLPQAEVETAPDGTRWEPQSLRPRHREIMRRVLEGASYVTIASEMGITPQSVMLVATSKMFRAELAKHEAAMDDNVVKRADQLSNEALDVVKFNMRLGRTEAIRQRAAERILDTAGYTKIERKLIGIVNGEDVIRELNKRKRESMERAKVNEQGQSTLLNVNG